ncbi:hypothetical protein ACYX8G_06410 [Microbacterium saperdae]
MVDLRARRHGAGATTGVNLVVMAYADRIEVDSDGAITAHHLDVRVHPADRRAPGETDLALVPHTHGAQRVGYESSARYTADQFGAIESAAGNNVVVLLDERGRPIGAAYGVKADLLIADGDMVVNTKALAATALSVDVDAAGNDIRVQIRKSVATAEAAKKLADQRNPRFTAYTKQEALSSEG